MYTTSNHQPPTTVCIELLSLTLHPLSMASSVLMRVLAYLLERRPAPTLHIPGVLFSIEAVILTHILRFRFLRIREVKVCGTGRLPFPTQHIHICLTARDSSRVVKQRRCLILVVLAMRMRRSCLKCCSPNRIGIVCLFLHTGSRSMVFRLVPPSPLVSILSPIMR